MRTLLAIALLFCSIPASADHCASWWTASPEVDIGQGDARLYVDNDTRCLGDPCATSIWVYEESNGLDGLQRGDEVVDTTCHGMIEADTIIL